MSTTSRSIAFIFFIFTSLLVSQVAIAASKYTIQVSSYSSAEEANASVAKLKEGGLAAFETKTEIPGKGTRYRVNVGSFNTPNEAAVFKKNLTRKNQIPADAIVQKITGTLVAAQTPPPPVLAIAPVEPTPPPAPITQVQAPPPAPTPELVAKIIPAVTAKVKGFAVVEYEQSKNFGYDGTSGIANFTSTADGAERSSMNLFANLGLDVKKGYTTLSTLVQVGELYFGDNNTGGAQGTNRQVLKLRNMYINHIFTDEFSAKAGLIHVLSDARGFILRDDFAGASFDYKSLGFESSLWFAQAYQNPPGVNSTTTAPAYVRPDSYLGLTTNFNITSDIKSSVFGVYRKAFETFTSTDLVTAVQGDSSYYWVGISAEYSGLPFSADATYIMNSSNFMNPTISDNNTAGLANARLKFLWAEPEIMFSAEGLSTTGASDVVASGLSTLNKRKNYAAPTQGGASYMFLIATSNGYDDTPGALKQTTIAPLSLSEGLTAFAGKLTKNFGSDFSIYATFGVLNSTTNRAATASNAIGSEFDLGMWYKLSSEATWHLDYGSFTPGAYYTSRDTATMLATKVKYDF